MAPSSPDAAVQAAGNTHPSGAGMYGTFPDPVIEALAAVGILALVGTGVMLMVGIVRTVRRP